MYGPYNFLGITVKKNFYKHSYNYTKNQEDNSILGFRAGQKPVFMYSRKLKYLFTFIIWNHQ